MLQFWYEFASTYSYPAAMRLDALAETAGVKVAWRPFLLGPIFARQGWTDSPFNIFPEKGRYMWRDMTRICVAYGIAFQRPSTFPRHSLLAARIALIGQDKPWVSDFSRRVYAANFADDADIGDAAVIGKILADLGLNGDALLAEAATPAVKQALAVQTASAERLGVFGAPTCVVGGELFWGNDRLDDAIAWARRTAEQEK